MKLDWNTVRHSESTGVIMQSAKAYLSGRTLYRVLRGGTELLWTANQAEALRVYLNSSVALVLTPDLRPGMRVWTPLKSVITPMTITHIGEPKEEQRGMLSYLVTGTFSDGTDLTIEAYQDARWHLDI